MSIRQGNKIIAGNVDNADYTALLNKPQINSIELSGNKTLEELGIQAKGEYALKSEMELKADKADTLAGYGITDGLSTSQITNCITKIPQDIKLELSEDGTLTLKAGSKVYYLDGSSKIIQQDITTSTVSVTPAQRFLWVRGDSNFGDGSSLECYSGNNEAMNAIVSPKAYQTFYNTEQKKAFRGNGTNWEEQDYSLPIALISNEPNVWTSIDQVFNGFGYIGGTIFSLPGVEGLIPNGRNADGSLNNTKFTTSSVFIRNNTYTNANMTYFINASTLGTLGTAYNYDEYNNLNLNGSSPYYACNIGSISTDSTGRIISHNIKPCFQAVDINDTEWASTQCKPSERYVDLTLQADGTTYTAPANGTVYFSKEVTSPDTYIWLENLTSSLSIISWVPVNNGFTAISMPVSSGDKFTARYTAAGTTNFFRFIYDEGVK